MSEREPHPQASAGGDLSDDPDTLHRADAASGLHQRLERIARFVTDPEATAEMADSPVKAALLHLQQLMLDRTPW